MGEGGDGAEELAEVVVEVLGQGVEFGGVVDGYEGDSVFGGEGEARVWGRESHCFWSTGWEGD